MKDQKKLVQNCINNDIPVLALSGKDKLSLLAVRFYLRLAIQNNCSPEFIEDLKEQVAWFEEYAAENYDRLKLPD